LLEYGDLARDIMATKEQEKLLAVHEKMQTVTMPDYLVQQWSDGLRRILHESNSV